MLKLPFRSQDIRTAQAHLSEGIVKAIVFSDKTYQIEVEDALLSQSFWTFLQLKDNYLPQDYFCTCEDFENHNSCMHLAASYLKIFSGHQKPLHVRYRSSLFFHLCEIGAHRHGYDTKLLTKEENSDEYIAKSSENVPCFGIKALSKQSKEKVHEILFEREEETEESSIKFSNLPSDEIDAWRRGRPSKHLQFELSFWSDLAKYLIWLFQEKGQLKIFYEGDSLPTKITLKFADIQIWCLLSEANWPDIIPCLIGMPSPLKTFPFSGREISSIVYDEKAHIFSIVGKEIDNETTTKGEKVGDWIFQKNVGFFPKDVDPILKQNEIQENQIPKFLSEHITLLEQYLENTKVHKEPVKAKYHLFFDENEDLHIEGFLFEKSDMQKSKSYQFNNWTYVQDKGFYFVEDRLFEAAQKVISREKMSDFINHHRLWLNQYEGFQTHLSSIESRFVYELDKNSTLQFNTEISAYDGSQEVKDFGEWIYIHHQGFFSKSSRGGSNIQAGMQIPKDKIGNFIEKNRTDLEQIKGFFAHESPIIKAGIHIRLTEKGFIEIDPEYTYDRAYEDKESKVFGRYSYIKGEGFCEIPKQARLPKGFEEFKVLDEKEQMHFISFELSNLKPYVLSLDPKLEEPANLTLQLSYMRRDPITGKWIVSLSYKTEYGTFPASFIWKGIKDKKPYLMTKAGLFYLNKTRFDWLRYITKESFASNPQQFQMSTVELLRLKVFEHVQISDELLSSKNEALELFEEDLDITQQPLPSLAGFESNLRPYQEIGVKWLWHLYRFGMSGILCDEMGLGKTHQAMGLICAIINEVKSSQKILIVCPTSVIYHWEELLEKFLPKIDVQTYHGPSRSLKKSCPVLLTSYGVLRSDKDKLTADRYELAIFDEMQVAKNKNSQISKTLRLVKTKMVLGLSGTPIENYLIELKALFDIALPGYFPSDSLFKEMFVNPIEKGEDSDKRALLHSLITPFVLRRKKGEVLQDLPEKVEEISYIDLSTEQKKLYKSIYDQESSFLEKVDSLDNQQFYIHVFALLNYLKQVCDHPALYHKKPKEYHKHSSGKWELFVELLNEARASNQKVVVFSQYLDMLNIIENYLKDENIGFAGIRGSTRDRKGEVARFRDDPKCEVFVASLQAAGVGIDLVAASVVIHYDRWWNPAKEDQATDRVHRIGQNRNVLVYKLVTKNTVEEHIHRLIERKQSLIASIVGYDDKDDFKQFDREELVELLKQIHGDIQ